MEYQADQNIVYRHEESEYDYKAEQRLPDQHESGENSENSKISEAVLDAAEAYVKELNVTVNLKIVDEYRLYEKHLAEHLEGNYKKYCKQHPEKHFEEHPEEYPEEYLDEYLDKTESEIGYNPGSPEGMKIHLSGLIPDLYKDFHIDYTVGAMPPSSEEELAERTKFLAQRAEFNEKAYELCSRYVGAILKDDDILQLYTEAHAEIAKEHVIDEQLVANGNIKYVDSQYEDDTGFAGLLDFEDNLYIELEDVERDQNLDTRQALSRVALNAA